MRSLEEKNERPTIHERAAMSARQVAKNQLAELYVYMIRATLQVHNGRQKRNFTLDHGDHGAGVRTGDHRGEDGG